MADQILNVRLYDNPLTPETNDYTGKVQMNGTLYNADVARKIIEQRSELRYDTILSILNMADDIKRTGLATGYGIIDGVAQMRPSVTGRFDGAAAQFDISKHSKGVIMSPTPEMLRAMELSKVVVLGTAQTGPVINRVEDMYTQTENKVITPGRNLRIYGQRLRIAGDDPAVVGVWFVGFGETSVRTRLNDRDLIDNEPSRLTLVVPALAAGGYFVEVVTQSTANRKNLLKEPRTYRFEILLTVES
jgi:hypothetical protein